MEDHRQLLDYLAKNSGLSMKVIDDIEYLYDTLFIEVFHIYLFVYVSDDTF